MKTTLEERIDGRQWAEEVLQDMYGSSEAFRLGFLRQIKRLIRDTISIDEIDKSAMSDDEARQYGRSVMEFGLHKGSRVDDVPLEYLTWLVSANAKMARYLRSRRIAAELDAGEPGR